MKYALNLAEDSRILSACVVLGKGNYDGMTMVDALPDGNIADYLYQNGGFVYNPLPEPEEPEAEPTQLDRIEAQVTYTAMITDTLLPGV